MGIIRIHDNNTRRLGYIILIFVLIMSDQIPRRIKYVESHARYTNTY